MRILPIVLFSLLAAAQTQKRDLKLETDAPERPVTAAVAIPRSYALVVGIGEYRHLPESAALRYAIRDAEAIYSILISPEGGNFRAENVHKLIGEKATLLNVRKELEEWLPKAAQADDRVLIYFAGHGFVRDGHGYLAPYDIDPKNIAASGYPMETLGQVIGSRIQAKWKVLLTDACHSGAITPADSQALNARLQDLSRSLFSFTASRDREQSFEGPDWGGGHGVFTYYVVKGLEGAADESRDGIVTADELAEYVRRNVREATGGKQNPTSDRGSFDSAMLLSFLPAGAAPGTPPPPKDGVLVFESNMDEVEVFLDGRSAGVVSKGAPLRLPGLKPGVHSIKAVKMGYEPDGPREETVYPGQTSTVSIKITVARRRNRAAVDAFDQGMEEYNKGFEQHYRKAAARFDAALAADPSFSRAALFAGRAYNALFDNENARERFRTAVEIDPDYIEARASFAGMLLDVGDLDEAVRQANAVVQRDGKHALAWCMLAQALRRKDLFADSIEAARKSIQLNPANGEPHLWLGESLRLSGKYADSLPEYQSYLRLSDFDNGLAGKMNYYVAGFLIGMGKKKRAAQQDIWKELRSQAFFGLCDSERKMARFDRAIEYCRQALAYDSSDPYAHYALALSYARKAQETGNIEMLPAARKHFAAMLEINGDLAEAPMAKKNIASIDSLLASAR